MDHGQNELISVIMPAYNAEDFIDQTLLSALAQTYRNLEIIVVDDGSSDRTADIVKARADENSRIRLIRQENSGVAAAEISASGKLAESSSPPLTRMIYGIRKNFSGNSRRCEQAVSR